jgi:ubiquitin-protein ligase
MSDTEDRMTSNKIAQSRLQKELQDFCKNSMDGVSASPVGENMFDWLGRIEGPLGTPYEGGTFFVRISVPSNYPFKSPSFSFLTKIYHCNIDGDEICLDILGSEWTSSMTIGKVLLSLQSLFSDPNPDDPLNSEVADTYNTNRKKHDEKAKMWTQKYAMSKDPPPLSKKRHR